MVRDSPPLPVPGFPIACASPKYLDLAPVGLHGFLATLHPLAPSPLLLLQQWGSAEAVSRCMGLTQISGSLGTSKEKEPLSVATAAVALKLIGVAG